MGTHSRWVLGCSLSKYRYIYVLILLLLSVTRSEKDALKQEAVDSRWFVVLLCDVIVWQGVGLMSFRASIPSSNMPHACLGLDYWSGVWM